MVLETTTRTYLFKLFSLKTLSNLIDFCAWILLVRYALICLVIVGGESMRELSVYTCV